MEKGACQKYADSVKDVVDNKKREDMLKKILVALPKRYAGQKDTSGIAKKILVPLPKSEDMLKKIRRPVPRRA